jgi:signal transduction histidine kinase
MRTMFIKLFFWFWLATILSGMVFFLLAFNLRLGPAFDEHMRHFDAQRNGVLSQALAFYGRGAAAEYERAKSQGGISDAQPGAQGGMQGYLFAADGSALSRGGAPKLRNAVRRMAAGGDAASAGVGGDVVVVKVLGPSGKSYWAAAQAMHGQPPRKPFRRFPFPPDFLLQMLITFVVSGFVCYGLSWRITAPVRKLRTAVQGLALGDLATRVSVSGEAAGDELSDLGRDFNLMAVRIEKLVTAHKQLVRDVSHELRSPLARLNVALGLARKQSPPSAEPALDRIEVEGERLNLLIGELLTLSQLEGGAAGERTGVELSALAEEVARDADFEGCASNRRVHYTPAPAPQLVQGDREMLRRALENVVRNAVRYTEEGSSVEVSLRDDSGPQAVLRVRDSGPGVPEELLSDIFRPFYRVAQARDRQSGGTGIGLAITERIVTLHGGTVVARNLPGRGLEVEIMLPRTARD